MIPWRLHLFEFNDSPRAPEFLRDAIIEALGRTLERGGILAGLVPHVVDFVRRAGTDRLLDIGAGSGAPAAIILDAMRAAEAELPHIVLTDLFPRPDTWQALTTRHPDHLSFIADPVDATSIPEHVSRGHARMIINVFHHFAPPLARAVIRDAVQASSPMLIAECFGRNPLGFAPFAPHGIPAVLGNPLYARRHRGLRALFTWGLPVIPVIGTYDGLVSTLRCYTPDELRAMFVDAGAHDCSLDTTTFRFPYGGRGVVFTAVPPAG